MIGAGRQIGPLLPQWGDGWADLRCDVCSATWTGPIDEACSWCVQALERMRADQAAMVLHPPDVEPDDARRTEVLRAWAGRLARAVEAGLITRWRAQAAWSRERRRDPA